jgi:acetyl-CoA carboxylase biotin carboxyl carrier protein
MDIRDIKKLLDAFDKSTANILEFENEEFRIYLDKTASAAAAVPQNVAVPATPAPQNVQPAPANESENTSETVDCIEGELITSPMVGTFYQAPSPDSPPYVKVGDKVKKGQTLCIIEAMKIMNELEAEFDCEILEILVEDGQPVEFDTPLFRVKRV